MSLDPQVKALLDGLALIKVPSYDVIPPALARQFMVKQAETHRKEPVASVEDRTVEGPHGEVPIRIYKPETAGPHPALVFYHGGGWVLGSIETHDALCRSLTRLAECVVISVDYRLAPEHKFPIGLEDSYAATQWVFDNARELEIDPARVAVGGDSAGGNFATVVCYLARERGHRQPMFQLLLYPSTDLVNVSESRRAFAEGYFLTSAQMKYFGLQYLSTPEDIHNPMASPMMIEDLRGLPPAFVLTAEYDPLRDEGEAYANRLREAGVDAEYTCYAGMIHGFMSMADRIDRGYEAIQQTADVLKRAFNK